MGLFQKPKPFHKLFLRRPCSGCVCQIKKMQDFKHRLAQIATLSRFILVNIVNILKIEIEKSSLSKNRSLKFMLKCSDFKFSYIFVILEVKEDIRCE